MFYMDLNDQKRIFNKQSHRFTFTSKHTFSWCQLYIFNNFEIWLHILINMSSLHWYHHNNHQLIIRFPVGHGFPRKRVFRPYFDTLAQCELATSHVFEGWWTFFDMQISSLCFSSLLLRGIATKNSQMIVNYKLNHTRHPQQKRKFQTVTWHQLKLVLLPNSCCT